MVMAAPVQTLDPVVGKELYDLTGTRADHPKQIQFKDSPCLTLPVLLHWQLPERLEGREIEVRDSAVVSTKLAWSLVCHAGGNRPDGRNTSRGLDLQFP